MSEDMENLGEWTGRERALGSVHTPRHSAQHLIASQQKKYTRGRHRKHQHARTSRCVPSRKDHIHPPCSVFANENSIKQNNVGFVKITGNAFL